MPMNWAGGQPMGGQLRSMGQGGMDPARAATVNALRRPGGGGMGMQPAPQMGTAPGMGDAMGRMNAAAQANMGQAPMGGMPQMGGMAGQADMAQARNMMYTPQ